MKKLPQITTDEWLEAEAAYANRHGKPTPEGWVDSGQYAQRTGFSRTSASTKLKNMTEAGLMERKEWRAVGCNKSIWIYRPKNIKTGKWANSSITNINEDEG